jgi:hypothetical protein
MKPDFLSAEAEKRYYGIPVLSPEDVQRRCGFSTSSGSLVTASRIEFLKAMVTAIHDPGWLLVPFYDEITRKDSSLPASQNLTPSDEDVFKQFQHADSATLFKLAQEVNMGHKIPSMSAMATGDLVARSLEMMGHKYPNLTMFRGTNFDTQGNCYEGYDFAPGDLPSALDYSQKDAFGRTRKTPIIAMVSFLEVARLFSMKKLWIATEGEWWRGSLEIHFLDKAEREAAVKVRRLPQNKSDVDQILKRFKETSIKV